MLASKTPEMKMAVSRLKQLSQDEWTRMLFEARELAIAEYCLTVSSCEAKIKLQPG
jgi:hypothetical protein